MNFQRRSNIDAVLLHEQVDALRLANPYCIEWGDVSFTFVFDNELTVEQMTALTAVVSAHDGAAATAHRAEREAKIAAIASANSVLVESAREKRLRGEQMTQPELAALIDLLLFPV